MAGHDGGRVGTFGRWYYAAACAGWITSRTSVT